MTRAVRRATAAGDDAPGTTAAAALASRPAPRRGASQAASAREAGECWSLRLTPDERRALSGDLDALTEREREVALAICDGGSNEAVADRLYIALPTLRTHLMRINQKLGTRSKGDVVRLMVGRLLEGYRAGRVLGAEAVGGSPSAHANGSAAGCIPAGAGRIAEVTVVRPEVGPAHELNGDGRTGSEASRVQTRANGARPKIIDPDDDSRLATARMAGSL